MEKQESGILEFEKPVFELQKKIEDLKHSGKVNTGEISKLMDRLAELESKIYRSLSPWENVLLARHPKRPTTLDYIRLITDHFEELHGDRYYGDDTAVVGGIGDLSGMKLMIVGHEKGRNTRERIARNFGMARPEGFRKSLRLFRMAEKFSMPVLSIIDTPGAYPGIEAEQRGQPRAIADNLKEIFGIRTPIVVVIIGEGGSGGALALAVGDAILMMEHAVYSVISPEGCAAILWNSREKAPEAAASLKLTSRDCLKFGVIDAIIEEVHGAAHRDPQGNAKNLAERVIGEFQRLSEEPLDLLLKKREEKFFAMGKFEDGDKDSPKGA
ncbi:MAG: acetyl-CoA carboxylase carboxyltransferase subunit alpha [Candidatus Krumholzibacteriota bacterium]|nr:acetyl-CoA carboxylase carboxyltransferase subunit alpha [Candidatus Krumholzibacteriota bacterium]